MDEAVAAAPDFLEIAYGTLVEYGTTYGLKVVGAIVQLAAGLGAGHRVTVITRGHRISGSTSSR